MCIPIDFYVETFPDAKMKNTSKGSQEVSLRNATSVNMLSDNVHL